MERTATQFTVWRQTVDRGFTRVGTFRHAADALIAARSTSADDVDAWYEVEPNAGPRYECDDPITYMHGERWPGRGACVHAQAEVATQCSVDNRVR